MKLDDGVSFRLARLTRTLHRPHMHRLRRYRLTVPQLFLLLALYERDDVTAGELAERIHVDKGTITGILRRLESNGLITRTKDENDGRSVRVTLTDKGRRLRRPLSALYEDVNQCLLEALGAQQTRLPGLLTALERAADKVQ